jgi:hypothetical protein
MENQGTVYPKGAKDKAEFDFKREIRGKGWVVVRGGSGWTVDRDRTGAWQDDEQQDAEANTPTPSDHIYQIDGPGYVLATNAVNDREFEAFIYRDWAMVKLYGTWYRCSGYLRWHQQLYVRPRTDDPTLLRRAGAGPGGPTSEWSFQKLGSGWIDIPSQPPAF